MSTGFPLPDITWDRTRNFWEAAARDELAVPRCASCERFHWYPPEACPACGAALTWTRVSGRGRLFSFAVVTRALFKAYAAEAPYTTGLVSLEEDPSVRMVTRFVDCDPDSLEMDMPVRVVFRDLAFEGVEGSVRAPFWTPATAEPTHHVPISNPVSRE